MEVSAARLRRSTSPASRRTSRSWSGRCTANASSTWTLRPRRKSRLAVIEAMSRYYETTHANVHRGVYEMAQEATRLSRKARAKVASFIGAAQLTRWCSRRTPPRPSTSSPTPGAATTSAPRTWSSRARSSTTPTSSPGCNCKAETGTELRFLRLGDDGMLALDDLGQLLEGAKLLAVTAASNVLGTLPPVRALADAAHAAGALVLVDGAQYVPHMPTSVADLGADFVAFTGHKMLGPTGIGALWAQTRTARSDAAFLDRWRDDP